MASNFEKAIAKAVASTDKAMAVFHKAHAKVAKESENLNNLLNEVEDEIARLRAVRDDIVTKANKNDSILEKLLHVIGIDIDK